MSASGCDATEERETFLESYQVIPERGGDRVRCSVTQLVLLGRDRKSKEHLRYVARISSHLRGSAWRLGRDGRQPRCHQVTGHITPIDQSRESAKSTSSTFGPHLHPCLNGQNADMIVDGGGEVASFTSVRPEFIQSDDYGKNDGPIGEAMQYLPPDRVHDGTENGEAS